MAKPGFCVICFNSIPPEDSLERAGFRFHVTCADSLLSCPRCQQETVAAHDKYVLCWNRECGWLKPRLRCGVCNDWFTSGHLYYRKLICEDCNAWSLGSNRTIHV